LFSISIAVYGMRWRRSPFTARENTRFQRRQLAVDGRGRGAGLLTLHPIGGDVGAGDLDRLPRTEERQQVGQAELEPIR
jgi:hypothetical protein